MNYFHADSEAISRSNLAQRNETRERKENK